MSISILFFNALYNLNISNNFVFFTFEMDEENVHDPLINRQQNFNDEEIKMKKRTLGFIQLNTFCALSRDANFSEIVRIIIPIILEFIQITKERKEVWNAKKLL